jgi:hypothetical protein
VSKCSIVRRATSFDIISECPGDFIGIRIPMRDDAAITTIATAEIDRQRTRESRTHANSPWEDSAMSSDLTELGQEAIAAVSRGVVDGAPLVKCQLLASAFYEALRDELRKADATRRSALLAVTDQCHRSAAANISPVQALDELRRAVNLLQPAMPGSETVQPVPRSRPVLRVIQGGLSSG